jgi:hypothetical protein
MARLLSNFNILKTHQSWEDLFSAALGVLLLVSPIMVQGEMPPPVMFSVLATGIVVLAVSLFEIMMAGRWEEVIQLLLGVWRPYPCLCWIMAPQPNCASGTS